MKNYRFNIDAILERDEIWDFEICEFEDAVGNNNSNSSTNDNNNDGKLTLCEFYSRAKLKDIHVPVGALHCLINTFL